MEARAPAPHDSARGERTAAAAPDVRVTNRRLPDAPAADPDEKLFPEEGSAEGCASGECLPAAAEPTAAAAPPAPAAPAPALADPGDDEPSLPTAQPLRAAPTWRGAVEAVKAVSSRHGASLAFGRVISQEPGKVRLAFSKEAGFHRATVTGNGKAGVEKALSDYFRRPTVLVVEESDAYAAAPPSMAEVDARGRAEREKSAESRIRTHPAVRAALKLLGGEIEHVQVLEEERPAPATPAPPDD